MEIFYGHLQYFTDIWDILWPFGTFCVHLQYFKDIWDILWPKIWQPWFVYLVFCFSIRWHNSRINLKSAGSGLPDDILTCQKFHFCYSKKGIGIEFYGIFQIHWVYLMTILNTLKLFGMFSLFWYSVPRKIWQPCVGCESRMREVGSWKMYSSLEQQMLATTS
jgi:hypothetical protein